MEQDIAAIQAKLAEPFRPNELEWRGEPRGVNIKDMKSGDEVSVLVFTYVQARAIQNRLDQVMGIDNWYDTYQAGPAGGVVCSLSLFINGRWITKQGIAANTQIEAEKGGESEALKRAAYKWSIGRYLYEMPEKWCKAVVKGRGIVLLERPSLPGWAYPYDWKGEKENENAVVTLLTPAQATALTYKETPAVIAKAAVAAKAELEKQQAEEQLARAKAYTVPTGHGLPNEGQTYAAVLEASTTVGLQLLKIIAGRAEGDAARFEAKTPSEKSARSAAIYVLDHLPTDAK